MFKNSLEPAERGMKASFFQLITGAAIVGTLVPGVFTPAQAIQVFYGATLNGANEDSPNTSPGTGTATLTYNDVLNTLRVQVSFLNLEGNVTAAHIHSPTTNPGTGTAGVALGLTGFPTGNTFGNYDNTFTSISTSLIDSFNAGTSYVNIHSSSYGTGEIRGFVTAVPWETDALSVVGTTLLFGFGIWKKNKLSQRNLK